MGLLFCACTSMDLWNKGCTCGFAKQVREDEQRVREADLEAAKRRLREVSEWFSPMPTGYQGDRPTCPFCPHAVHEMQGYGCQDANCLCGSEKI